MKKKIFVAIAILAGSVAFAQQKKEKQPPPPPPPPPVANVKDMPPPPPPPKTPPPPKVQVEQLPSPVNSEYEAFLKQNPTVKGISWSNKNLVRIHLKSGKDEVYDMNKENEVQKLKEKYGELPVPPPPPPAPRVPKKINES